MRLLRRLAMTADATETINLLMIVDQAQGSDAAMLNALAALSTLRLEPTMFVEQVLSLACRATNAIYGAVVAGERVIAAWGRPRVAQDQERETLTVPILFGKTPVGVLRIERDRQSHVRPSRVSLDGVAGPLSVPLHRLGAHEGQTETVPNLLFRGVVGRSPAYRSQLAKAARLAQTQAAGTVQGRRRSQLAKAARLAQTDGPLVIVGECGTGRRLLARAVHESGRRATAPFTVIHCDVVPDDLLADELFGHPDDERAGIKARPGRLAVAGGGTVVLFELDARSGLWPRLEAIVETHEPDVRIITVTSDAEAAWGTGCLRPGVPVLTLPPLRERRPDIAELARFFVRASSEQFSRDVEGLSSEALARLEAYDWPGNVQELQQAIERAVVLAEDRIADICHLPPELRE